MAAGMCALLTGGAHAAAVDLGLWYDESYPAVSGFDPGIWTVSGDGLSVNQSVNGQPTLFVSDFDVAGLAIEGTVTVNTPGDDDYIGFALGFEPGDANPGNGAADYLLVDWKQANQFFNFGAPSCTGGSTALAGLAVSRVTGIPTADEFWGHFDEDNATCSPLGHGLVELQRGANLGAVGWADFTSYTFRFEFTTTSLKVFVDGVEELNIAGTFNNGRLAFYNFSQSNVTYSAFVAEPLLAKELTSGPDRDGSARYDDFSDVSELMLNGDAAQAGSVLRLTPAALWQGGSAFTTDPLMLGPGGSFSTQFAFRISNPGGAPDPDGAGADGLTFVLQNDVLGNMALGGLGGDLGYTGIGKSLIVEFDTWDNEFYGNDPDGNHVGTAANGVLGSGTAVSVTPRMNDGGVFYAWIEYDGIADQLEVRLSTSPERPAAPTLSESGLDLAGLLDGTSAFVGFTSATGAAFNDHDILYWHFGGIDVVVPVGELVPTAYDFTITWNGSDPVLVYDRVPAEWDVTHVEFDGIGDDGLVLPLDCGEDTVFTGGFGEVEIGRGGKSGKTCNSDTGFWWLPGDDNTLNIQTLARCHDNNRNQKCRPTSCGALYLNYGAVAFLRDPDTDELVLDDNGDPILVEGPTDPICLAAVEDVNGDGTFTWDGSGDEDGDDLSDFEESCVIGTDPCLADTDGDGVPDNADACPLDGDEGYGVDAFGCPIPAP